MSKFISKLVLFTLLFLIYDKIFIIITNLSANAEVDKRLEWVVRGEMNKDIIVAGSSTGSRGIIAGQIEEKTKFSAYNLSYPGSDVEFHEFVLRALLEFNCPPKIVFLVVDDDIEFTFVETIIYRKDRLYPLVKYRYIWKELAEREDRDSFFSNFIILNRLNKYNFDFRTKSFTPMDTIMDCGSMPISWQPSQKNLEYLTKERKYSTVEEIPERVNALRQIIQRCDKENIELVLVFPPLFKTHSLSFENRIRQLADGRAHFYIYNKENPAYRNKNNFFDEQHLMQNAARIFTDELIIYIKRNFANESSYQERL